MLSIASICKSRLLGLIEGAGDSYDRRPATLTTSNSRAFAFVTSAKPCWLPSKSAGLQLPSRFLCPNRRKTLIIEKFRFW
jgi:hypothetical protein